MILLITAAIMLAVSPEVRAQAKPNGDEDIVVTGRVPLETEKYLENITKPMGNDQLARWRRPICIRLESFADAPARYIRISVRRLAKEAGVKLQSDTCPHPDVIVVATEDSDELIKHLLRRSVMVQSDRMITPNSRNAMSRALNVPRPIRWLTVSETVDRDGVPQSDANQEGMPVIHAYSSSFIEAPTRADMRSVLVVVDAVRVAGVTLRQLADYIGFVVLAAPAVDGDYRDSDTILSLFQRERGTSPEGVTRLDTAYLTALYATSSNRTGSEQKAQIRKRLTSRQWAKLHE